MDWTFLHRYHAYWLALLAGVAAIAALAANVRSVVETARTFYSWLRSEPFNEPILLRLGLTYAGKERGGNSEEEPTLYDITISYEGRGRLIFDRIHIRHFAGWLQSLAQTGQLISRYKYQFSFSYNSLEKYDLNPPLVLDPSSESLLRFQVEIAPRGVFLSSGGPVYVKLAYRTGEGRIGVLPLVTLNADAYRNYPDIYRKILSERRFEFPVFETPTRTSYETFLLTRNGSIKGKPWKQS